MAGNLTAMIAAIFSGGVTPDPYYEYTTLLLPGNGTNGAQNNTFLDGSTNNFTITRNGNTTQGTFSPFSQTGWGNYFNGSSSLTPSSGSFLAVGTNNYTIEFWVYLTANAAANHAIAINATNGLVIVLGPTKTSLNQFSVGDIVATGSGLSINTWHHVAIVRSGTGSNQTAIYIDGVRVTVGTDATNWTATGNPRIGGNTASQYITGYLSNIRVVNSAIYSGTNITVPISPLSPSQYAGTTFLTCQNNRFLDNGSTQATFTANGSPTVVAFSPFNPTASWSAATNGGSGYFDGSGDYLSTPNVSALRPGASTNPFSIECWIYPTVSPSTDTAILGNFKVISYPGNCDGLDLLYTSTRTVAFRWGYPNYSDSGASPALNINTWSHIVICRNASGSMSCFLNGARWFNTSSNTSITAATAASFWVGWAGSLSGTTINPFPGYISGTKFLNGSTGYDPTLTTLTIPSLPPTNTTNTSLLLNFTNAGIYDATSKLVLETVNSASLSNAIAPKWGSTSIKFASSTSDYLWSNNQPAQVEVIGTSDFTIEGWVYLSTINTAFGIISRGTSTTGWSVNITSGNKLQFSYTASSLVGATSLVQNTWYYFAVVRSGSASGNLKLYLSTGGAISSADATSAGAVTDNFNQTNAIYVGADRVGTSLLNGYLQDIRLTNYARTITAAPTAAFPTL